MDFADQPERYDLILDTAGNRPLAALRRALTPKGTLVIVGGEAGGRWLQGMDRLLRGLVLAPFVSQRIVGLFASQPQADLEFLLELLKSGRITPVIDRTYPLSEAADAVRYLEQGHARGKIILMVEPAI